jgi:hypothetical protein
MVHRYLILLLFFSFLAPCYPHPANKPTFRSSSAKGFIENKGQIIDQDFKPNPGVLYLLNTPGFNVQLRKAGFSYDVYQVLSQQSIVTSHDQASGIRHPSTSGTKSCNTTKSSPTRASAHRAGMFLQKPIGIHFLQITPTMPLQPVH